MSVLKLDAAFRKQWADAGVAPAEPAADLAIARRLALGLTGTVPSLEELRQFEALAPADRLPWYVDHLLADRRFDDYLAERLARAAVGTEDGPFILFRRRRMVAWLSDQLREHRPYDALVRDLIAGTGLWTNHPATNFISVTSQADKDNQPDPIRLAGRVSRAFLGLRIDCAQCHDHPFANWTQGDFEGLAAFFGQTHVGLKGITDGDGEYKVEDRRTRAERTVAPKVPSHEDLLPADGARRQRLAEWVTHKKNPYFARAIANRTWALLTGKPLVDPVDNIPAEGFPPALQVLADDFAAHDYDLRRLIRVIAFSQAFRLDSASAKAIGDTEEAAWAVFPLTRLRPEQVAGGVLQASQVATLGSDSHILVRLIRFGSQNDFVTRYGDTGDDEFVSRGGTIPQRLLLMNGELVRERTKDSPFNATGRIATMAKDDGHAIETAYLATLTRRPTPDEAAQFAKQLADTTFPRSQRVEDLYWALVNSTEFSWNH